MRLNGPRISQATCLVRMPCMAYSLVLKMEVTCYSETSADTEVFSEEQR
jgi:hypothetical protein